MQARPDPFIKFDGFQQFKVCNRTSRLSEPGREPMLYIQVRDKCHHIYSDKQPRNVTNDAAEVSPKPDISCQTPTDN